MFEKILYATEEIFDMLRMLKTVYDSTGCVIFNRDCFDIDYYYEIFLEAFYSAADKYENFDRDTDWCYEASKLYFKCMHEYYLLSKQYGKIKHISFKNNPYIKEAKNFVNARMCEVDDYNFNWNIFMPKKECKKKRCSLIVVVCEEFIAYSQLISALYAIRDFFEQGVTMLKKALNAEIKEDEAYLKERMTAI